MTNLIPSPNYTSFPNVVFDYWLPNLKPREFLILMCILRNGSLEEADLIPAIRAMSGMSEYCANKYFNILMDTGLITRRCVFSNGESERDVYYFINESKLMDCEGKNG